VLSDLYPIVDSQTKTNRMRDSSFETFLLGYEFLRNKYITRHYLSTRRNSQLSSRNVRRAITRTTGPSYKSAYLT
jgi:hypothetical protein